MSQRPRNLTPAVGLPSLATGTAVNADITQFEADTIVVNVFKGVTEPGGATGAVNAALGGAIADLLAGGDLKGNVGDVAVLYSGGKLAARRVLVTGLGEIEKFDMEVARRASANALVKARELGAEHVATIVHGAGAGGFPAEQAAQATLEGALLTTYRFGGWRESKEQPKLTKVTLVEQGESKFSQVEAGAKAAVAVARGVAVARDLANLPPNVANPLFMAQTAREIADRTGMDVFVGDREWMEAEGMGAILAVAQGSANPPAMIKLEHNKDRTDLPLVAIVGKGVTFDSGGLSLKTPEGMKTMKGDMGGSAAVLGAMQTVGELNLPIRVIGIASCVENMPDGAAFRPSDVLVAGNGKSIEILSTDAEGRLALADALWYVQRFNPEAVVDIATLTGASVVALGAGVSASLTSNNAALRARIETASEATCERVWHMPMFDEHRKLVESKIADLKNAVTGGGGVSTAAVFLEEFTDYPWAHIDMAGMEFIDGNKGRNYLGTGATGYGARLFVEFLRNWS